MREIKAKVYFVDDFDECKVDMVCDEISGTSFWFGNNYAKFRGSGEKFEEFKRLLVDLGIKIKEIKIT